MIIHDHFLAKFAAKLAVHVSWSLGSYVGSFRPTLLECVTLFSWSVLSDTGGVLIVGTLMVLVLLEREIPRL